MADVPSLPYLLYRLSAIAHQLTGRSAVQFLYRRAVGAALPDRADDVAAPMGAGHSVPLVPTGSTFDHLHHERYREPAHATAEDREET